jgi:hypothetical protein
MWSILSTRRRLRREGQGGAEARLRLSVEFGAPSCAKGGPNRGTLLEARHQLLIERHYADTRRPFADIRQQGAS